MAELPASSPPATQPWQFNEYKEAVERPQDLERALVALEIAATLCVRKAASRVKLRHLSACRLAPFFAALLAMERPSSI